MTTKFAIPFGHIEERFDRAREKLHVLQDEFLHFIEGQGEFVTHHVDKDAGKQFWRFDGPDPAVPVAWSLAMGEVLYLLRSSLDHVAWLLVLKSGGKLGRRTAFPIADSAAQFSTQASTVVKGVSARAQAIIERLQPYKRRNKELARLNLLCNTDKHRYLHLAAFASSGVQSFSGSYHRISGLSDRGLVAFHAGPVEADTVLLSIAKLDVDVHFYPSFNIAFAESQPAISDMYVSNTLFLILAKVDEAIRRLRNELL